MIIFLRLYVYVYKYKVDLVYAFCLCLLYSLAGLFYLFQMSVSTVDFV